MVRSARMIVVTAPIRASMYFATDGSDFTDTPFWCPRIIANGTQQGAPLR